MTITKKTWDQMPGRLTRLENNLNRSNEIIGRERTMFLKRIEALEHGRIRDSASREEVFRDVATECATRMVKAEAAIEVARAELAAEREEAGKSVRAVERYDEERGHLRLLIDHLAALALTPEQRIELRKVLASRFGCDWGRPDGETDSHDYRRSVHPNAVFHLPTLKQFAAVLKTDRLEVPK